MVEIISNLHPVFVHFAVSLLATASVRYVLAALAPAGAKWSARCLTVARWNLWIGAIALVATLAAIAAAFIVLAIWSFMRRQSTRPDRTMAFLPVADTALLAITGWKGGELIYRYGLGVLSMPKTGSHRHGMASDQNEHPHTPDDDQHQSGHGPDHHHQRHYLWLLARFNRVTQQNRLTRKEQ